MTHNWSQEIPMYEYSVASSSWGYMTCS